MNEMMVSEPDWARLSEEWEQSSLSQRKFCEQRGVSYYIFRTQRAEIKRCEREAARLYGKRAKGSEFLPVTVEVEESTYQPSHRSTDEEQKEPSLRDSAELEVELPFGVVLRFRGMPAR